MFSQTIVTAKSLVELEQSGQTAKPQDKRAKQSGSEWDEKGAWSKSHHHYNNENNHRYMCMFTVYQASL